MLSKMLKLARRLPWPLHAILAVMTNGAITAPDRKNAKKDRREG